MASVKEIIEENNKLTYKINQNQEVTKIILTFNKNNEINNITPNAGEVIGSFEKIDKLNELLKLIGELLKIIGNENKIRIDFNFTFIVNNEKEEEIIKEIVRTLRQNNFNNFTIQYSEEYKKNKEAINMNIQEKEIEKELKDNGTKEIIKHGINGEIQRYTEINGKLYDDNLYSTNINELKERVFREMMNDPVEKERLKEMSKEEISQELNKKIENIRDLSYSLNSPNQSQSVSSEAKVNNVANKVAENKQNDAKVNGEIGIIVDDKGKYTAVEQDEYDDIKVVAPNVSEQSISSSTGINTTSQNPSMNTAYSYSYNANDYDSANAEYENNPEMTEEEIQSRELTEERKQGKTLRRTLTKKPNGYVSFMIMALIVSLMLIIATIIMIV